MSETAGDLIVRQHAPNAPETIKAKAKARIDDYITKSAGLRNPARSDVNILLKSGAGSILAPWLEPSMATISYMEDSA